MSLAVLRFRWSRRVRADGGAYRWAFVDFKTPEHSTRALLNVRNHTLAGRALNVEYASLDAVRRGGFKVPGAPPRPRRGAEGTEGRDGESSRKPRGEKRPPRYMDDEQTRQSFHGESGGADGRDQPAAAAVYDDSAPKPRPVKRGREDGARPGHASSGKRAKPGAALANAQRASEAIVASAGKKIKFD